MYINKEKDIGFIFNKDTVLPIKFTIVEKRVIKNKKYKGKNNTNLMFHDEILNYYIATETIKGAEHLLGLVRLDLYKGLTDLNISLMIRANHKIIMFLPEHLRKEEYNNINDIISKLNEPVMDIAHLYSEDNIIKAESFKDVKTATMTLNSRYKIEKGKTK